MNSFQSAFSLLQRIGKCMMLPVSVLPVAGILLGVGSANFSWLPDPVSKVMAASGSVIFGSLPLLFAIGVAIGLTENDGVAALAGTVGFAVFLASMGVFAGLLGIETKTIMGLPTIETGVFGGILVGFIAAAVFNRFYRVQLPSYLGFFAGKRSVPIITAFAAIALAAVLILDLAADRPRNRRLLLLGRSMDSRPWRSPSTESSSARSSPSACTTSGTFPSSSRQAHSRTRPPALSCTARSRGSSPATRPLAT